MIKSIKYMRNILMLYVFITTLTTPISICADRDKQIVKEIEEEQITINEITFSSGVEIILNKSEEQKEIKEIIKLASNGKPYVYYKVYDFFYGTEKYHELEHEYQEYTYELCIEYDIEEYYPLILCQLFYESKYDSTVISSTNDYGIAQINKFNHEWLSEKLGVTDFLDTKQSIKCNIFMMSGYLKKYSVESSLFCYNTGNPNGSNAYSENIIYMWENGIKEIKK